MRAHYLQHVPFEGLGSIGPWLEKNGFETSSTKFFNTTALPDPSAIDLLIILGGPMSVHDTAQYPWINNEIRLIKQVINAGKPVLGICLGAQLIAHAMGAKIYRNTEKEIGWFPVQKVSSPNTSHFSFPDSALVFHWHGETFTLPEGATLLARSQGCKNQAFQIDQSIIGLQFHLETTPESAQKIVFHCRHELTKSTYVQNDSEILSATPEIYASINTLMEKVLNYLTHNCD
jgi:GMP synthase-like glutamine amidotransferase